MKQTALSYLAVVLCTIHTKAQNVISAGATLTQHVNILAAQTMLPSGREVLGAGVGTTANRADGANASSVSQTANGSTPATGGSYNWGTTSGADRGFGLAASGSYNSPNAVLVKYLNNAGPLITSVTITFQIKRYRINSGVFALSFYDSPGRSSWTARPNGI